MTSLNLTLTFKYIFLTTCVLLISIQVFSQNIPSPAGITADISTIRTAYQQINSATLTKKHYSYESSGCVEEGEVNYYFNSDDIVKITESGSIGDGSWVNEYYYTAGKLIFCLETIVGGPAIGKVTKTQCRYYIKNDRPLRVLKGNKITAADSKATEIIKTAYDIYGAYKTKNFAAALCN